MIAGDGTIESNETFAVTLSHASSGLTLGTASATATIINDDVALHQVTGNNANNLIQLYVADTAGNLFIADPQNHIVVRVDTRGILTVYAGNGFSGSSGDNLPATQAALEQRVCAP